MAVKIGPVIGIDGESDFRNSIKNMIQQGKTLSAEMDKVKQSFKNADDKQTAYAKVAEKLSEQIENQQKIVDKFREAVEKSTEETGETSDQTLKWKEQLAKGGRVTLVGFGTFGVTERPARVGRNPRTGAKIKIAAKKSAKFKAGKGLL